ncbi:MAG: DUF3048 domain-containing protein [Oscillospiraceae bacterium]|nr:DUF3048 domain-containing protein [Oscillospiraceae bacterium]
MEEQNNEIQQDIEGEEPENLGEENLIPPLTLESKQRHIKRRRIFIIGGTVFAALIALAAVFALVITNMKDSIVPPPLPTEPTTEPIPGMDYLINPLTGLKDLHPDRGGKRPVSVMVNNAPAARPQWGLCSPDIILETMVEGGITRLFFMYADPNTIPKIGPIRSARHDFVEIAEGFDSFFIHWGGSPQAYEVLRNRGIHHLDGMSYSGKYFFRDKDRRSRGVALEHTGYTSGTDIMAGLEAKGWRQELHGDKLIPFQFSALPRTPADGAAYGVDFQFSNSYRYSFAYNPETQLYAQSLGGKPFVQDGDGKQREVGNIVLLYVNVKALDGKGRVDIELGGGKGVYISAGAWEAITWKKGEPHDALKLYNAAGQELRLNQGKGYIGIVPSGQQGKTVIRGE